MTVCLHAPQSTHPTHPHPYPTHTPTLTPHTLTHTHTLPAQMQAIQQHIPLYLSHITQLLNNIPRQLVLILKTNDLLRSLEYSLDTPVYHQSYIIMSRYPKLYIKVANNYKVTFINEYLNNCGYY